MYPGRKHLRLDDTEEELGLIVFIRFEYTKGGKRAGEWQLRSCQDMHDGTSWRNVKTDSSFQGFQRSDDEHGPSLELMPPGS